MVVIHTHLGGSTYTPSILEPFPPEGAVSMQRPEITIAAISSSHTSLYCPEPAQSTWSPWRQRCVLWVSVSQGRWFLQQCSEHCGDKVPIVPCPYSCEWGRACSTPAASYLCLWLCCAASLSTAATPGLVLLWIYAPERPRRALHHSHTHQEPGLSWQPKSCNSPTQRSDFSSQWMSLCFKHTRGQHCNKNGIGSLETGCRE